MCLELVKQYPTKPRVVWGHFFGRHELVVFLKYTTAQVMLQEAKTVFQVVRM